MSYSSIAASTIDQAFVDRVSAATIAEAWNNPAVADSGFAADVKAAYTNARTMVYPVAVASDVEAAYESALAAGNPDPGGDPAVVTDAQILSNVQAKCTTDAA